MKIVWDNRFETAEIQVERECQRDLVIGIECEETIRELQAKVLEDIEGKVLREYDIRMDHLKFTDGSRLETTLHQTSWGETYKNFVYTFTVSKLLEEHIAVLKEKADYDKEEDLYEIH